MLRRRGGYGGFSAEVKTTADPGEGPFGGGGCVLAAAREALR